MIEKYNDSIACKLCGECLFDDFYTYIDIRENPELKEFVLSGKIFIHKCKKCSKENIHKHYVTYYDPDKKFKVILNDYKYFHEYDNKEDIQVIGVTNISSFVEDVLILDKGYDLKVFRLYAELILTDFKEEYIRNGINVKIINKTITCDNDELFYSVYFKEKSSYKTLDLPLSRRLYLYESLKDMVNPEIAKIDSIVFEEETIRKLLLSIHQKEEYKKSNVKLLFCVNLLGEYFYSYVPSYNTNEYDVDNIVLVKKGNYLSIGKVIGVINTTYEKCFLDPYNLVITSSICKDITLEEVNKPSFNAQELFNSLERFTKTRNIEDFPSDLVSNSDVLVRLKVKTEGNIIVRPSDDNPYFTTKKVNERKYLRVYLDKDYVSESPLNKVYKFQDVIDLVLNNPHKYIGIIINPKYDDLILHFNNLKDYKIMKLLEDKNKVINILENLSNKEIDYLGEAVYKIMYQVYIEGKDITELSLNISVDDIKILIQQGLYKLIKIISTNY